MKTPKLIGTYKLGLENVRIFVSTGDEGATAYLKPNDGGCMKIVVQMETKSFDVSVSSLLHELVEVSLHRARLGYYHSCDVSTSVSGFLFVMDHEQMNSVCYEVAPVMCDCMEKFRAAWDKINKVKTKK